MISSPATVPITRSQRLARSVLRTNPTTCGNQVYLTGSDRSLPTTSAILFSKPSPFSSENGRLLGSAQTRSSVRATSSPVGDLMGGSCAAPGEELSATAAPQRSASRKSKRQFDMARILLGGGTISPLVAISARTAPAGRVRERRRSVP